MDTVVNYVEGKMAFSIAPKHAYLFIITMDTVMNNAESKYH